MSIVFLYFFNIFIVEFLQLPIFSSMDDKNVENRLQKHDCKENAPAEEFLHCIDIGQLLRELNLDLESLCDWLGLDSQTVNRWSKTKEKNGNRPKFNAIVRMLRNGATTKTLFGIDTSSVQKSSATDECNNELLAVVSKRIKVDTSEFKKIVNVFSKSVDPSKKSLFLAAANKIVGGKEKAKPFGLAGLQYIESKIK